MTFSAFLCGFRIQLLHKLTWLVILKACLIVLFSHGNRRKENCTNTICLFFVMFPFRKGTLLPYSYIHRCCVAVRFQYKTYGCVETWPKLHTLQCNIHSVSHKSAIFTVGHNDVLFSGLEDLNHFSQYCNVNGCVWFPVLLVLAHGGHV